MIDENQIEEIYSLNPSGMVQLFELDLTEILDDEISLGEGVFYFYNGNNFNYQTITWNGIEFQPLPSEAMEFGMDTNKPPRPKIKIANVRGAIGQILQEVPIEGGTLRRYVVPIKYLPASNFKGGNPWGETEQENLFEPSVFIVERKLSESPDLIEYELSIPIDMEETKLPSIQVMANVCPYTYRGKLCGYKGCALTDKNNNLLSSFGVLQVGNTIHHTQYFEDTVGDIWYYEYQDIEANRYFIVPSTPWTVTTDYASRLRKITEGGEYKIWREFQEDGVTPQQYTTNDIVQVNLPNGHHFLQKCIQSHTVEKPNKSYSNFQLWARDYCNKTPEACFKRFGFAMPYGGIIGTANLPFK